MRMVKLIKLGCPGYTSTTVTIPFNGDLFEFLDADWRALARQAAGEEDGVAREDGRLARVYTE